MGRREGKRGVEAPPEYRYVEGGNGNGGSRDGRGDGFQGQRGQKW